jgi:lipopolysaccharide exporter
MMNAGVDSERPGVTSGSVARAAAWTIAARQLERVLGIVSISVTARLLTPGDFGLVGMALAVLAVIEVFSSFGFDWALVRMSDPTKEHFDTAWTLRMVFGLATFAAACVAAYPAAAMYRDDRIVPLIAALGLAATIGSLENIGIVEFRRRMDFMPEFQVRFWSKVASLVACWGLAWATRSYWSLVGAVIAARLVTVGLSYALSPYRPRPSLARRSDLLSFSVWMLAGNLVQVFRARFSEFFIGRTFGAHSVGVYGVASEFSAIASTELAAPLNRAVFGRYAQMQGDRNLLREGFERVSGLIWLVGLPAALGIGACARELIAVLLGRQWADSAALLQVLAAAGVVAVMAGNTQYVYWALGRSRFVMVLELVATAAFIVLTLIFARGQGVIGVALAQCVASALVLLVNYSALRRTLNLSWAAMGHRLWRIVTAAGVMLVSVVALRGALLGHGLDSAPGRLGLLVPAGIAVYAVALGSLWLILGRPEGPERVVIERAAPIFVTVYRRFARAR